RGAAGDLGVAPPGPPGGRAAELRRGPGRSRLERAARRWGVADRVRSNAGSTRRAAARDHPRGLLVHPSFHDDAPLCFAEALSLGTPVVCLDNGGPAGWGGAVPPAPAAGRPP